MACSSTVEKDHFLCPKDPQKASDDRSSSPCSDNDDDRVSGLKKLRKSKDFAARNKQKMKDELASSSSRSVSGRTPSLVPRDLDGGYRRVSFLERSLFPGIKPDFVLPVPAPSSTTEQSKTAQLTIFYAGAVNAYDDVPADKAQAIMLLASQSSESQPTIGGLTKDQVVKSVPRSHSPSLCKTQEDLPIARRQSLRRFLDKRRNRIISKRPLRFQIQMIDK